MSQLVDSAQLSSDAPLSLRQPACDVTAVDLEKTAEVVPVLMVQMQVQRLQREMNDLRAELQKEKEFRAGMQQRRLWGWVIWGMLFAPLLLLVLAVGAGFIPLSFFGIESPLDALTGQRNKSMEAMRKIFPQLGKEAQNPAQAAQGDDQPLNILRKSLKDMAGLRQILKKAQKHRVFRTRAKKPKKQEPEKNKEKAGT